MKHMAILTDVTRCIGCEECVAACQKTNNTGLNTLADQIVGRHGALGGGDVWHLMAALQLKGKHDPVALLSFDSRLAKAAEAEGLAGVDGKRVSPEDLVTELTARDRWIPA